MGQAYGAPMRSLPDPGVVLLREGLASEAIPFLLRSHEKEPNDWEHLSNLGVAHRIQGELVQAKDYLKQALRLSPQSPEVWTNWGILLDDLGDFADSLEAYRIAFSLAPSDQLIAFNYSAALLRHQKFSEAWPLWEFGRYNRSYFLPERIPKWEGERLEGKRIAVLKEGGYGDAFLYMRYVERLKRQGAHVTMYVWDRLKSILDGHGWIDNVVTQSEGLKMSEYDFCIPIMSLPAVLAEEMNRPHLVGYLRGDAQFSKHIRPLLGNSGKLKVGICWQAEERGTPRKIRSIGDKELTPLSEASVDWVSLQYQKVLPWMRDLSGIQSDWKATAALIECLDLVVTVDTGVANLAGAMGKAVWIILPINCEWKWFLERTDSPIYPTARLFRASSHNWTEVIRDVLEALSKVN